MSLTKKLHPQNYCASHFGKIILQLMQMHLYIHSLITQSTINELQSI